eukprot:m.442479 g.442479  ORF g.442479 m.442479 type:complete len:343 (-) comp18811_c0_seq1:208-1236(-)
MGLCMARILFDLSLRASKTVTSSRSSSSIQSAGNVAGCGSFLFCRPHLQASHILASFRSRGGDLEWSGLEASSAAAFCVGGSSSSGGWSDPRPLNGVLSLSLACSVSSSSRERSDGAESASESAVDTIEKRSVPSHDPPSHSSSPQWSSSCLGSIQHGPAHESSQGWTSTLAIHHIDCQTPERSRCSVPDELTEICCGETLFSSTAFSSQSSSSSYSSSPSSSHPLASPQRILQKTVPCPVVTITPVPSPTAVNSVRDGSQTGCPSEGRGLLAPPSSCLLDFRSRRKRFARVSGDAPPPGSPTDFSVSTTTATAGPPTSGSAILSTRVLPDFRSSTSTMGQT